MKPSGRSPPHDFPPRRTVYTRSRLWRIDGTWEAVHARLRGEVRTEAGGAMICAAMIRRTVRDPHPAE